MCPEGRRTAELDNGKPLGKCRVCGRWPESHLPGPEGTDTRASCEADVDSHSRQCVGAKARGSMRRRAFFLAPLGPSNVLRMQRVSAEARNVIQVS